MLTRAICADRLVCGASDTMFSREVNLGNDKRRTAFGAKVSECKSDAEFSSSESAHGAPCSPTPRGAPANDKLHYDKFISKFTDATRGARGKALADSGWEPVRNGSKSIGIAQATRAIPYLEGGGEVAEVRAVLAAMLSVPSSPSPPPDDKFYND